MNDLYDTDATAWVAEEIEDVAQRTRDRIEGALMVGLGTEPTRPAHPSRPDPASNGGAGRTARR